MAVTPVKCAQLYEWLENDEQLVLLDVRTPQEVTEWKVPVESSQLVNIPYAEFERENAAAGQDLPAGQKVVVVCNRGRSAQVVADMLDTTGRDLYVLEGGMNAWSQFYQTVPVYADEKWKLFQLIRHGKGCLSYMICSAGEAIVVDPGRHVQEYVELAHREGVQIKYIFDTHLHADHISGASELANLTGATYFLSAQEVQDGQLNYEDVTKHALLKIDGVELKVVFMPTPGHTPGSVSFLVNGTWFLTGDTLFVSGLGRPDLGGKAQEWAMKLYETVFQTIAPLPDDVVVLPAHFSDPSEIGAGGYVGATLGEIRVQNDILRKSEPEAFTQQVTAHIGATPPNYEQIVQVNRGLVMLEDDKKLELEVGPNRCAVKHMS